MTYYFGDWSTEIFMKLSANSQLTTLLAGNLLLFRNLPRNFDRKSIPDIYDTNGFLEPTLIIRGRDSIPLGLPRSQKPSDKFTIVTQVIEIWMYDSSKGNWNTLNQIAELVYNTLEQEKVEDAWNIELVGQTNNLREKDLGDAPFLMHEYMITGKL